MLSSYAQKFWKRNDDDTHDMKHLLHLVEEVEHNNRANPRLRFARARARRNNTALGIESPTVILKRLSEQPRRI